MSGRIARWADGLLRVRPANVLQTFWAVAANVLQTSDRRIAAKPGETTHAIPCVFRVSCPCSLGFAEHEPIGETGSDWLSYAVFGASAVFLRSPNHGAPSASSAESRMAAKRAQASRGRRSRSAGRSARRGPRARRRSASLPARPTRALRRSRTTARRPLVPGSAPPRLSPPDAAPRPRCLPKVS
jgi:hypothetical protein